MRLIQLDFLRGVAILMVLGNHTFLIIHPDKAAVFRPLAHAFDQFGWTGVDLFFVLSGFLIGGLLFKELQKNGRLDVKRFIVRRGLKIWPSYYILLGWLLLTAYHHLHSWRAAFAPLIPNFLHIQSYVYVPSEHTWSLAVEEHFYLVLPFLLWLLTRRPERSKLHLFPGLFLAIAIACLVMRIVTFRLHPFHPGAPIQYFWTVSTPTHLRIDELMFGVLLAYVSRYRPESLAFAVGSSKRRWLLFAAGVALVSPMMFLYQTDPANMVPVHTIGVTLLYLGYGCILMACVHSVQADASPGRIFQTRLAKGLAWIGFYSYPIYLWHINQARDRVMFWVDSGKFDRLGASERWLVAVSIYMVLAIGFGVIFSKLLEKPMLAWRERFFPDRSATR